MRTAAAATKDGNVIDLQERRIGRLVLRTYRTHVDIDSVVPNERQPRELRDKDADLQLDIEANQGIAEPLLVEPHPDQPRKFRIIDGGRRWASTRELVRNGREQYRQVPVEVVDRTLSEDDPARQALQPVPVTRVAQRQAMRDGLDMRVRTEAARILHRRGLNPEGRDLDRQRLGRGNLIVVKAAIDRQVNATAGRTSRQRHEFTRAELDQIEAGFANIVATAEREVFDGD